MIIDGFIEETIVYKEMMTRRCHIKYEKILIHKKILFTEITKETNATR